MSLMTFSRMASRPKKTTVSRKKKHHDLKSVFNLLIVFFSKTLDSSSSFDELEFEQMDVRARKFLFLLFIFFSKMAKLKSSNLIGIFKGEKRFSESSTVLLWTIFITLFISQRIISILFSVVPEDPAFRTGVGQFSNASSFEMDQRTEES